MGGTMEGIDQNPAYWEFLIGASWRERKVADLPTHIVESSLRRYGISDPSMIKPIQEAWTLLTNSIYTQDVGIMDGSGVPHFPGTYTVNFDKKGQPTPFLCDQYKAWEQLLSVADPLDQTRKNVPFRYDLVNLGRELLAEISNVLADKLWDEMQQNAINSTSVKSIGDTYVQLLLDVDTLVGTDQAFLLGSWIDMARNIGPSGATDCGGNSYGIKTCGDFYEWNARTQITTWNPTPKDADAIPGGPIDYAAKQWNGLIRDYYAVRAKFYVEQALSDAAAGKALDTKALYKKKAELAYAWTTATNKYPSVVQGDYVSISKAMLNKYQHYYQGCGTSNSAKARKID